MLRIPPVDVVRPESLDEALAILANEGDARVIAGGTDLVPSLKQGVKPTGKLVSLSRLGLAGVRAHGGTIEIGAATTLWDIIRCREGGPAVAALAQAARMVAAPPIQSRATVGGNLLLDNRCFMYNQSAFWRSGRPLCHKTGGSVCHVVANSARCRATSQSDLAPVAIALGADAVIKSAAGERVTPFEDLYTGDGAKPISLAQGEILTSIRIKEFGRGFSASFEKIRVRKGLDFAVASASAAVLKGSEGRALQVRVVLGSLGTKPLLVPEAGDLITGSALSEELLQKVSEAASKAANPVKNIDLTPAYRRKVAGVLASRALKRAWEG